MKQHLLFVCTENRHRSVTSEHLFDQSDKYKAKSCGVSPLAVVPITKQALDWADTIFVMEEFQKAAVLKQFPDLKKQIIVLNVSDTYRRDDPELVTLLRQKLEAYLKD